MDPHRIFHDLQVKAEKPRKKNYNDNEYSFNVFPHLFLFKKTTNLKQLHNDFISNHSQSSSSNWTFLPVQLLQIEEIWRSSCTKKTSANKARILFVLIKNRSRRNRMTNARRRHCTILDGPWTGIPYPIQGGTM